MLAMISLALAVLAVVVSVGALCSVRYALGLTIKDFLAPRIRKGQLMTDHDAPYNHLDAILGREAADDLRRDIGVPEIRLRGFGTVGFIDSHGVLRTERGQYDPLAGKFTVPDGTVNADAAQRVQSQMADIIDLRKRRAGEQ